MMTIKTKENASLLMAAVAAAIVAAVMIIDGNAWWIVLIVGIVVFVAMSLFSLYMMKAYVAYKLKPIYSMATTP